MRRRFPTVLLAIVLLGLLAIAVKFAIDTWQHSTAVMSIHGYIALGLGVFFSVVIGCGLMALIFYSDRRGYDDQPKYINRDRDPPA